MRPRCVTRVAPTPRAIASETICTRGPTLTPSHTALWPSVDAEVAVNSRELYWPGGGSGASEGATETYTVSSLIRSPFVIADRPFAASHVGSIGSEATPAYTRVTRRICSPTTSPRISSMTGESSVGSSWPGAAGAAYMPHPSQVPSIHATGATSAGRSAGITIMPPA